MLFADNSLLLQRTGARRIRLEPGRLAGLEPDRLEPDRSRVSFVRLERDKRPPVVVPGRAPILPADVPRETVTRTPTADRHVRIPAAVAVARE